MHEKQTREGGPSTATETTLWGQAQAGCRQSTNQLMLQHEGLVHAVVRQQVLGELPYEMALHAGRTGLWRAIKGYDSQRGAFSTYAWIAIMRAVWAAVKDYHQEEEQLSLTGVVIVDEGQELARQWERKVIQASTRVAVGALPTRLQRVLNARYGLDGHKPATFAQIGKELGVSRQRAHQLHQEALLRLRQPFVSYQLRSLLDKQSEADYRAVAAETAVWLQKRGGRE